MSKNSTNSRDFVIEVTFFNIIVFLKSVVTPLKIRTKTLKCFPEKYFRRYCGFGFHWANYILSKF